MPTPAQVELFLDEAQRRGAWAVRLAEQAALPPRRLPHSSRDTTEASGRQNLMASSSIAWCTLAPRGHI